jgi:integrase
MTAGLEARASAEAGWPRPDTPVLRRRPVRAGSSTDGGLFGDPVWRLTPAHPDAHTAPMHIRWKHYPPRLVLAFKTFALATLDHPYPHDPALPRKADQPSVATIVNWMRDLQVLAAWLEDRQVEALADIIAKDLDAYRDHVLALGCTPERKAYLLSAVRILWAYRIHLPAACQIGCDPWDGATGAVIAAPPPRPRFNTTPRIAPATMEPLLAWALRMTEDIGPDIAAAWREYRQLDDGTHPSQAALAGLTPRQRLEEYLRQARSSGQPLPGHGTGSGLTVNYSHLARILGFSKRCGYQPWRPAWKKLVCDAGLPVAAGTYLGAITGRISGQPWRAQPVTIAELAPLARLLGAAAFSVICYLSGMRPGEVLNLRRGCASTDEKTSELLITGQPGKGHDRRPQPGTGGDPGRPWVVVQSVHTAIAVLEALVPGDLLFPASIARPGCRRASTAHARSTTDMNQDIEDFIAWVNATFTGPAGTPLIPPDPAGRIYSTRFRRTLAYFIVRRPGGLIAAALQYGHVHSRMTLGYAGAADTGWLDDLTVERLEMVLDQADADWRHLAGGEHVSGPAAGDYRARVQATRPFAGRAVTSIRAAERLLAAADPSIHHGEAMTCVWRAETAACRNTRLQQGLPVSDAPEPSECQSSCRNLVYTDRDIAAQRERADRLTTAAADPAAPAPLRDRAAAQAAHAQAIIDRHDRSRRAGVPLPEATA